MLLLNKTPAFSVSKNEIIGESAIWISLKHPWNKDPKTPEIYDLN